MRQNDTQRNLVKDNHNLIYSFLERHGLDVEVYYDIAAIGLCKAGATYDDSLMKFSTYAYKCMWNSVFTYIRSQNMQRRIPEEKILHYEDTIKNSDSETIRYFDTLKSTENVSENVVTRIVWGDIFDSLKEREKQILRLLGSGYSQTEIGKLIGCTPQNVSRIARDIRENVRRNLSCDSI